MTPKSNKPVRLLETPKTNKFPMKYYDEITASELKCRPIVNQTGTTFGTAKVIYEYSNPIETINYIIHKIYGRKLVKLIFKKQQLIFKCLLYKFTTDCTIQ